MSRSFRLVGPAVLAVSVLSGTARAELVTIDFDDLPSKTQVTDQYPEATFSSDAGSANFALLSESSASWPNILCTGSDTGGIDCLRPTTVTFTTPVNDLSLVCVGVNSSTGVIAWIDYLTAAGPGSVPVVADGGKTMAVDLSSIAGIQQIRIHSITDPIGLGWDDFRFRPDRVITFEEVPLGLWKGNTIPGVTFSTLANVAALRVTAAPAPFAAWGHVLGAVKKGGSAPLLPVFIDFPQPVQDLRFRAMGSPGGAFVVRIWQDQKLAVEVKVGLNPTGSGQYTFGVDGVTRVELTPLALSLVQFDNVTYALQQASVTAYGTGHPGTAGVPALDLAPPQLGDTVALTIGNSAGTATTALLLLGLAEAAAPTPYGGSLLVKSPVLIHLPLPAAGLEAPFTVPNQAAFAGAEVFLQAIVTDAGASDGFAFSRGLEARLGD